MAFGNFKNISEVMKTYKIRYREQDFEATNHTAAPEVLREDITFTLNEVAYDVSEAAICENLVYPILKAAWRQYADVLAIWSRQPLVYNEILTGAPDYVISKKSELGKVVFDSPYVAVVEAKKDDFTSGWGQCAAEMYAMQQLNDATDLPIFGVVSNGETWEIAQLEGQFFTKYRQIFVIQRLDEVFSMLTSVLDFYKKRLSLN